MATKRVIAVSIGHPEILPGKRIRTGINKHPVTGPLAISELGLKGDAVCDKRYHGGVDQAVYVEGGISLDHWTQELGRPVAHGEFGENLVLSGLDNTDIAVGDRLEIGNLVLETTAPRMPCATFSAKMADPLFVKRYRTALRPGFYCRVIKGGDVAAGMEAVLVPYRGHRIAMTELMRDYGKTIEGDRLAAYLTAPIHHKLRAALSTGKIKF